jgi:DNA end-binding protein Ku
VKAPEQVKEPKPAPDLMAALQETLERMGSGGKGGDGKLDGLSREQLYERAQAEDVPNRSKMSKEELVEALSGK